MCSVWSDPRNAPYMVVKAKSLRAGFNAFNPGTWGGRGRWISVSSRPAWFTKPVQDSQGSVNTEKPYLKKQNKHRKEIEIKKSADMARGKNKTIKQNNKTKPNDGS